EKSKANHRQWSGRPRSRFCRIKTCNGHIRFNPESKNNSSNFVNEQKFLKGKFSWQEGYGVFSYAHSQIDQVYQYIAHQEEHHRKKTFKEEYLDFLQKFEIEYEEKFLFEWLG